MNPKLQVGLSGRFILEAINAETGERRHLAEFDNIITDGGLDRLGSDGGNYVIRYVQVGTGSTTPAVTDSALANHLAGTDRNFNYSPSYGGNPTYHTEATFSWQFNQGVAAGNLSEVGVGWEASGSLFSRALIVDGNGNPTTITVASNEYLTVTYMLRMYPPTTDVTGQITLDGAQYDYIVRASEAGGYSWGDYGEYGFCSGQILSYAFTGVIGNMTGSPSGTISSNLGGYAHPYANGSHKRVVTFGAGIGQANFAGGIRSVRFTCFPYGGNPQMQWQCQFDPAIPKDNTKTLSLTFDVSWARKP